MSKKNYQDAAEFLGASDPVADAIASAEQKVAARAGGSYTPDPDSADPDLDRRLMKLAEAGQHAPTELGSRALTRWADQVERRIALMAEAEDEDRAINEANAADEQGFREWEAERAKRAAASAWAKQFVDETIGGGR